MRNRGVLLREEALLGGTTSRRCCLPARVDHYPSTSLGASAPTSDVGFVVSVAATPVRAAHHSVSLALVEVTHQMWLARTPLGPRVSRDETG
jgi:hypothetical protein